ncbi:SAM-dependent methyltransferase [Lactococcus nasutitermitis]|uniref:SAM-dependent methyltransferase n=1 Tax=Lactococcus nasutitermitis TaxID=1652957 RepID=A0ABV9JIJ6_9LACT|nr:class I SAM-dependent methyltransferase [Lactococcus nasutitermitis]
MNMKVLNTAVVDEKSHAFLQETMWGPNAIRQSEELVSYFTITEEMRILDLGCGPGLSSLYLAQEYGAEVFATDLMIEPAENYERFQSLGVADKVVPLILDATQPLPFAKGYFDVIFSVGAYNMFGDNEEMLPKLASFVKKGGYIAVSFPGLKYEFGDNVPPEMQPFWDVPDVAKYVRGIEWWKDLWSKARGIEIVNISEQACHKKAWQDYLNTLDPQNKEEKWDLEMMTAEAGQYFNTIQLIAKVV